MNPPSIRIHNKLSKFGINCHLMNDYLENRSFKVRFKGSVSNCFNINSGNPQSSNVGPLLFTEFINEISTSLRCR